MLFCLETQHSIYNLPTQTLQPQNNNTNNKGTTMASLLSPSNMNAVGGAALTFGNTQSPIASFLAASNSTIVNTDDFGHPLSNSGGGTNKHVDAEKQQQLHQRQLLLYQELADTRRTLRDLFIYFSLIEKPVRPPPGPQRSSAPNEKKDSKLKEKSSSKRKNLSQSQAGL